MAWQDWLLPDLAWQSLTPELVVLMFAVLAPLVGVWDTDRKGMRQFAFIGLAGAFLITLGSLLGWQQSIPGTSTRFTLEYIGESIGTSYAITEASQLFKLIFLGVALVAVIGMGRELKGEAEKDYGELYSLLLFATLGMMVVASAQDLIVLLLGIETASMSSYLMAGFKRDRRGAEAALKYFIIGAISSGMMLFAVSLLYAATGTVTLTGVGAAISAGGLDAISGVAVVLLLAGLGFKISSAPFHAWAPDVYHGSPAPVAGVLATASKAMGFAAIFSVFLVTLGGVKGDWELAVAIVAILSMFVGNLIAIQQTSITRMLAYSSIAQAGYILIALVVGTWYALGGGILHLMVNAGMKLGAFLIVAALLTLGLPDTVRGWRGLGKRAPFLAIAMTIFLLSMAGIPPLGGFTSKFVLFSSAIDTGVTGSLGWLVWLAVAAVINSAISLFYYVRLMRSMYVDEAPEGDDDKLSIPAGATFAVGLCLLLVLAVGIWPQPFVDTAMSAAQSLLTAGP